MSHIVLKWNPSKWSWPDLPARLTEVAETGSTTHTWDCSAAKHIAPGDRVLLLRVGRGSKGLIGTGTVTKPPFEDGHWDPDRAVAGNRTRYIEVQFDRLASDPLLSADELKVPPFDTVNWFAQAPIIYVPDEVLQAVEDRLQSGPTD